MNKSLWLESIEKNTYPSLNQHIETDVLVIGGGITGISCALELAKENKKVVLVDSNQLLHGTTGYTTSKLTIQHSLIYDYLKNKFGFDNAWLYKDINTKAIEQVKHYIKQYDIDCDFNERTAYVYTDQDKYISQIEKEYQTANELEIDTVFETKLNLPYMTKAGVGFQNQAEFNVAKYLIGLVKQLEQMNCHIFEQSKVIQVKEHGHCESLLTNGFTIKSDSVIMASHYPCHKHYDLYFTKLIPSFSYVMALETQLLIDDGMYINVEQPIRSLRKAIIDNKEVLLMAGESHNASKTHDKDKRYEDLKKFANHYFQINQELYRWSNMDYSTTDQVPLIGRANRLYKHVYTATGYSKWGMTSGIAASLILKDLILNKKSQYEGLFDPCRMSNVLTKKFFTYNLKQPKKFIQSKLVKVQPTKELKPTEQKMIKINGKKYGAYKNEAGEIFIVDITCPHLKCSLHFNQAEQTYDCMCHGSRFTYEGHYLDGPSKHNLKIYQLKMKQNRKEQ